MIPGGGIFHLRHGDFSTVEWKTLVIIGKAVKGRKRKREIEGEIGRQREIEREMDSERHREKDRER